MNYAGIYANNIENLILEDVKIEGQHGPVCQWENIDNFVEK